jgi:hypothetical protein
MRALLSLSLTALKEKYLRLNPIWMEGTDNSAEF